MEPISLSAISFFMPIFSFLLVFIIIYAVLKKTGFLGGSESVMLFVSFILASFFIVEASLVEFVRINSAWIATGAVLIFFVMLLIAFMPGKEPLSVLTKGNWFAWVVLAAILALFIFSSAYVFKWTINWSKAEKIVSNDWAGLIILLIVAALVSWKIKG
ncbi:hypothetical protein D6829_00175 [Candidatus Pacearchaeota archaeon]|nr:MAG: hypothetical protein D6829_00175 [Candidatus Pacearchaeota archaeon]